MLKSFAKAFEASCFVFLCGHGYGGNDEKLMNSRGGIWPTCRISGQLSKPLRFLVRSDVRANGDPNDLLFFFVVGEAGYISPGAACGSCEQSPSYYIMCVARMRVGEKPSLLLHTFSLEPCTLRHTVFRLSRVACSPICFTCLLHSLNYFPLMHFAQTPPDSTFSDR